MKIHLVDGTFELFRAHFGPAPGHRDGRGRDRKATLGVAFSMLSLLHDETEAVTHVAAAFDNPIRSFRNDLFPGYKTEAGVPEELLAQFDAVERAVAALGVTVWSMDRFEADDALAAAAARFGGEVAQVRILTPDKDLGQCIRGRRVVQVDRMRKREIDEQALRERRGIAPRQIPDWLALVGDAADGIPGIPGFGEKTASKVLARYPTVEAIPDDAADWDVAVRGAERLAATLAASRDEVLLYKRLATLVEDVPLRESLADLAWRGVPRERFLACCDELAAETLRDRPRRWRS